MSNTGLPVSRTDALSVIAFGLVSSLVGSTPKEDAVFPIIFAALGNVWAIASSFLTLNDIFLNDQDDQDDIETHLRLFLLGLLILTIVTSALSLLSMGERAMDCNDDIEKFSAVLGSIVMASALIFCLIQLYKSYSRGCDDANFGEAALCGNSTVAVLSAVIVAGLLAIAGFFVIIIFSEDSANGVAIQMFGYEDLEDPHSQATAMLTRASAFVKVCLLSVYWFLVDADMSWDTFNGHDASWWMTGQWAKQGVAIVNHFLNQCY